MDSWVDPRFHIAGMSDRAGNKQWFQIWGSKLHGVEVHDLKETEGETLVWLDEVAEINTRPTLGRLKVRYADLTKVDAQIAWRAKLTSSDDPEEELRYLKGQCEQPPAPEFVWLGVEQCRQAKWTKDDPDLPPWARGVKIIEAEDPLGHFAALGYTTPGGEQYYEWAKDYYYELLCRDVKS
jgi:hypothetical protein